MTTIPPTPTYWNQVMAPTDSHEQTPSTQAGQKRKREDSEAHVAREDQQDGTDVKPDVNTLIPEERESEDDDEDDEVDSDDDCENTNGPNIEYPMHDEDSEPFPQCAIYDDAIEDIEEKVSSIAERVESRLSAHNSNSRTVGNYLSTAENLSCVPEAKKIRIAILGGAGVGKSSLLNAVIGKPDLAKSLSGGQSCTYVPTEYQNAFEKQTKDFGAMIYYLWPEQIKTLLKETLTDYNTYAFEADEEWDEDTRTSAKKAHENALRVLRTLFNDLPKFKTKANTLLCLEESYNQQESTLVDELITNCELKLKHTVSREYTEWYQANTVAKLRKMIDPLMTSTGGFDQPALWPLAREVSIGVRDSRVLEKVTLIDLPGISDTNQARVDLTHDYIKTCDHVWVVAPISRVVDDGTVYQLLSRYGKPFKGMVCVICTHSDEGVLGSEQKLVNHFKQEDRDTKPFTALNDQIKAKKSEISELNKKINAVKKRKKAATKQQMLDSRVDEDTIKEMRQQCLRWESERFEFLVHTRNSLVTEQLQDSMQSHMPRGKRLEVHCVSNYHYAALKGVPISGPHLAADSTGIPRLRLSTIALMAPRIQKALDHYISFNMRSMLNDLQLWVSNSCVDRRPELLEMASQPRAGFFVALECRLSLFRDDIKRLFDDVLEKAVPDASQAALQQLAQKRKKHAATIMAFIRKNGNYATKLCPKECWNENFSKFFADLVTKSQATLGEAQVLHTAKLQKIIMEDLASFKKSIEDFPAPLPKSELATSINTYMDGARNAIESDAAEYAKDVRNILLDVTQDNDKNVFSRRIKPIYEKCAADKGAGVTKRSMDAIEKTLSRTVHDSAFAVAALRVSTKLSDTDRKHMSRTIFTAVDKLLERLYTSVDNLLDNKIVDEAEVAFKKDLKGLLPVLRADWEQASKELEAVKAKYDVGTTKRLLLN